VRRVPPFFVPVLLLSLFWAPFMVWGADHDYQPHFFDASAELGYRALDQERSKGRVSRYDTLESGLTFKGKVTGGVGDGHFFFETDYLDVNDYRTELHLDHQGMFRADIRRETLYRQLSYDPLPITDATLPGDSPSVTFSDSSVGRNYAMEVKQNEVKLQYRPKLLASHVTLHYWSIERNGSKALTFVDENCTTACHVQRQARKIDRITEEVSLSADAHLGKIDIIFEQLLRQSRERTPVPQDNFAAHIMGRPAGSYEHDADPEAKLVSTSLKAHTSLSGGAVAAAGITFGKRSNRSDLSDVSGVMSETDFIKGVVDLTYILSSKLTANVRYRYLNLDNDNSDQLRLVGQNFYLTGDTIGVRKNIDLVRYWYQADVTYRPSKRWTLRGELQHEDLQRAHTGEASEPRFMNVPVLYDAQWELPQREQVSRLRLSFRARPLPQYAMSLNGWYRFIYSDDPSYGTSFSRKHQGFLGLNIKGTKDCGLCVHLRAERGVNDDFHLDPVVGSSYNLSREQNKGTLAVNSWWQPFSGLEIGLNYNLIMERIKQDLLFGGDPGYVIVAKDARARQSLQTGSVHLGWVLSESLRSGVELSHTRSYYGFDPRFASTNLDFNLSDHTMLSLPVSDDGIGELSRVDLRQNRAVVRLDWTLGEGWKSGLEFSYLDYDEANDDSFDGIVRTTKVSLAKAW